MIAGRLRVDAEPAPRTRLDRWLMPRAPQAIARFAALTRVPSYELAAGVTFLFVALPALAARLAWPLAAGAQPGYPLGALALGIAALSVWGARLRGVRLAALGIVRPGWHDLVFVARVLLVLGPLYAALGLVGWRVSGLPLREFLSNTCPPPRLEWVFLYVVVAPLAEELVFRGFLFASLRRELGLGRAWFLSALVFMAAHLVGGFQGAAHLNHLFGGLVFGFAFARTGGLYAGMLLHGLGNGTLVALGFWAAG